MALVGHHRRVNSKSRIISTDEDPSLRIESSAIINLRGVSTSLTSILYSPCNRTRNLLFIGCHCNFEDMYQS